MASRAQRADLQTTSVTAAYDRWAPVYDMVFGKVFTEGRSDAIRAAEAALPEGGRVLEVGVGTGISLPHYQRSTRLVAVDLSDAMLDKARARKARLGLDNVEDIQVMDAEAMRFEDNSFEVVMAQYIITSCPHPEAALDEFVRVAKPGGEIIITTRIGANVGLRGRIEKFLMPLTKRLGFRTEFPYARYANWAKINGHVELVENTPLPPLGHFSMLRYRKLAE
ncbi:class I SAM-dependent methyltransferase [Aurantiacibacter suaedae]|uniref:class I SAM-dependent methyltransferase n=1 Tax=Aurantiacibacter suaedae TaxID=2545755 RepID=UPI0010F96DB2|nr:methyltransferase domain-containing protein [Aurantiacibacter suaedae]